MKQFKDYFDFVPYLETERFSSVKEKVSGKVIGRTDLGGFVKKTMAEISYHYAYEVGDKVLLLKL